MKLKKYLKIYLFCLFIYLINPVITPEPSYARNILGYTIKPGINLKANNLNIFALYKRKSRVSGRRMGNVINGKPISGNFAKYLIISILAFVGFIVLIAIKNRNKQK